MISCVTKCFKPYRQDAPGYKNEQATHGIDGRDHVWHKGPVVDISRGENRGGNKTINVDKI